MEHMSKNNMTFFMDKKYDDGQAWTDKIVGTTAVRKYESILEEIMADNKKALISVEKRVIGKIEEDIENKEEINEEALFNAKNKDTCRMKSIVNEDY